MSNQNQQNVFHSNPTLAGVAHHIYYNNGTLNFSRYIDSAMTPTDSVLFDTDTGIEEISQLKNIPNQNQNDTLPSVILTTTSNDNRNVNGEPNPFKTANGNDITPRPRKASFQVPFNNITPIATPHQPETPVTGNSEQVTVNTNIQNIPTLNEVEQTNQNESTQTTNIYPPHHFNDALYDSALLNKQFKPNPAELILDPETEPLRQLILSQHGAFTQTIKDLGITSVTLTKLIEKKKESCQQITAQTKTPRSLRLKCALTTSPSYTDNKDFLRLKEKLQEKTDAYIREGTEIMAEWAAINIHLLSEDRCHDILIKALKILDGLASYSADIIGTPNWPSAPNNNLTPLLLKLYISGNIFNVAKLIEYFELPKDKILNIGIKILTKNDSDEKAEELIASLNLADIDMNDDLHNTFVKETLLNFDQILRITTIYLWEHDKLLIRQNLAADKLNTKMKAAAIVTATESTALAITKATNNIQKEHELNLSTGLRLSNLEKSLKRQEQLTNEIYNRNKRTKSQKNFPGSRISESPASPDQSTPHARKIQNKDLLKIVDLTDDTAESPTEKQYRSQKRQHIRGHNTGHHQRRKHTKSVAWKENEVLKYNPKTPVNNQTLYASTPLKNHGQPINHQTSNANTLLTNQGHPTGTGHFSNPPLFHPSHLPYATPHQGILTFPISQHTPNPFNMGSPAGTLYLHQIQTQNQNLHVPQQAQPTQHQLNWNPRNNPFNNPFLQNK